MGARGFSPYESKHSQPHDDGDDDSKGDDGSEDMNLDDEFKKQSPEIGRQNKDRGQSQMGGRGPLHSAPPAYKGKSVQLDSCKSHLGLVKKMACKKLSLIEHIESEDKVSTAMIL